MPAALQRHFGRVKHAAGFNSPDGGKDEDGKKLRPLVQDYMRHTAISMFLAKDKHEGEAATWAGNSGMTLVSNSSEQALLCGQKSNLQPGCLCRIPDFADSSGFASDLNMRFEGALENEGALKKDLRRV